MYYGLVQAGLVITAAHSEGTWTFDKHGLKILDMKSDIPDIVVRPEVGAFQAVSGATGSERTMTDGSQPRSTWNSIPELVEVPLEGSKHTPKVDLWRAAMCLPRTWAGGLTTPHVNPRDTFAPLSSYTRTLPPLQDRGVWVKDFIAKYAGLQAARVWGDVDEAFEEIKAGCFSVDLCWPAPKNDMQEVDIEEFFDARSPVYRFRAHRYLRAAFEPGKAPPTPLMSWWLLLYSFSMLARYQPRKWTDALDIDRSADAASLEYALNTALEVVPHLVLEGLQQRSIPLSKPLAL
ncbi:hypothetical protein LV779_31100 [Streptomyces thinghirensis]|nr:hypothetical protein [Streptomyces thinghirensis]